MYLAITYLLGYRKNNFISEYIYMCDKIVNVQVVRSDSISICACISSYFNDHLLYYNPHKRDT